eukprot:scaffold270435_cov20-Prasinocladus_malaysianus.AAC.1
MSIRDATDGRHNGLHRVTLLRQMLQLCLQHSSPPLEIIQLNRLPSLHGGARSGPDLAPAARSD